MKKIILTFFLVVCYGLLFGQTSFQKTYGDSAMQYGNEMQVTSDGGFIIVGTTWSYDPNGDAFLLKTDSAGNVQWMKTYGGIYGDMGRSVEQTADGGYIFCGTKGTALHSKAFLVKTDTNGDTLWTKNYGDLSNSYWAGNVRQTSDLGYVISTGGYVLKTDSAGNLQWYNRYGIFYPQPFATTDSAIIILNDDLIKTNLNGSIQWRKKIIITGSLWLSHIFTLGLTNDKGFILGGYFNNAPPAEEACYLLKTDSTGDTLWSKAYLLNSLHTRVLSVEQTSDGGYIAAGSLLDTTIPYSAFALKTDASGNITWMKKYKTEYLPICVRQTHDGGFIILSLTGGDIYLIKTDSAGNADCNDSLLNPIVINVVDSFGISNYFYQDTLFRYNRPTVINPVNPYVIDICIPIAIETASAEYEKTINITPNPFTSEISITYQKENIKKVTFTIKNFLSQVVFSNQKNFLCCNCIETINLGFLSKGIYLLDVIVNGERTVKKIVKE